MAILNNRINHDWTAPTSGATHIGASGVTVIPAVTDYKVYREVDCTGGLGLIDTISGTPPATAYSDNPTAAGAAGYTALTDGTFAEYTVSAVNSVGEGDQSASDDATTYALSFTLDKLSHLWEELVTLSYITVGSDFDEEEGEITDSVVVDWDDDQDASGIVPVASGIASPWPPGV